MYCGGFGQVHGRRVSSLASGEIVACLPTLFAPQCLVKHTPSPRSGAQQGWRTLLVNNTWPSQPIPTPILLCDAPRWLDGLLEISTRASAKSESWMRHEDVEVGRVIRGAISRIDTRGARVRLGRGVYGTCASSDLLDKRLQRPHEKFTKGQAVQCVVLESEVSLPSHLAGASIRPATLWEGTCTCACTCLTSVATLSGAGAAFAREDRSLSQAHARHFDIAAGHLLRTGHAVSQHPRGASALELVAPRSLLTAVELHLRQHATRSSSLPQVISGLRPRSIVIRLFGGVTGIVRGSELKARFGTLWETDPTSCYREGQVVVCTVLSCQPAEKRLLLSLLSAEEAASRPAANLLNRSATKKTSRLDGEVDSAAKKRKLAQDFDLSGAFASVTKVEDVSAGMRGKASVVALGDHGQLLCRLGQNGAVRGRIHLSELADVGSNATVLTELPVQPIDVVVLGRRDQSGSAGKNAPVSLELSARPADGAQSSTVPIARLSMDSIAAGQVHPGWVRDVGTDGVWVSLSYMATGRVVPLEASDDPEVS